MSVTENGDYVPGNRPDENMADAEWQRGERRMSMYSMILSAVWDFGLAMVSCGSGLNGAPVYPILTPIR